MVGKKSQQLPHWLFKLNLFSKNQSIYNSNMNMYLSYGYLISSLQQYHACRWTGLSV